MAKYPKILFSITKLRLLLQKTRRFLFRKKALSPDVSGWRGNADKAVRRRQDK